MAPRRSAALATPFEGCDRIRDKGDDVEGSPGCRRYRGRRAALALLVVALLAVTLYAAGCGGEDATTTTSADDGILRLASWMTVTTWDPRASAADEPLFLANMYEPLLYANAPGSAEPFSPCLATSWAVSEDGMTWTFDLREGVTFHDGEPFDAKAVKYSIEATQELNLGGAYIWYPVEKITAVDDYTVEIKCSYPAALDRVATAMYGAWMFSPASKGKDSDWWNAPNDAGTGPYKLVSYAPNEETVFERYADYWGGWTEGQPKKVVMRYVDESGTQRQMLEAGEVDFVDGLSRDAIPAMQSNPNVKILDVPSVQNELVMFNTRNKPLDDVKVRQALSYAVNYEDVLAVATNGFGKQARGPIPYTLYPHDPATPQYTYDPAKARQLLAEAGNAEGLTLTMTYASDDAFGSKFAPVLKENFADVGVTLDLQPLLFEQQWQKAKGPAAERQDLFELVWWPGFPDGYDSLYSLFHSEEEPLWNMAYWSNKEYDDLIDTAFSDEPLDPDKAQEGYSEAQRMVVDQALALYLFDQDSLYGALPTLKLDEGALNPNYTTVLYFYRTSK